MDASEHPRGWQFGLAHAGGAQLARRGPRVDFRPSAYETACVTFLQLFRRPLVGAVAVASAAVALGGCDKIKDRLYPSAVDGAWQADSTLLAQSPTVLLRVVRSSTGTRAIPIASIGEKGLRSLNLTDRGWRALDVQLLSSGRSFVPYRGSDPQSTVTAERGMWEGAPLDTLAGCNLAAPAAKLSVPDGVELLTSGTTPLRTKPHGISDGELQEVLNVVNTLVAPSAGVSLSMMPRYKRSVSVVGTGATPAPTIVVTFEDPQELPDSVTRLAERPRQLILVLDKGVYGYKTSLTISDVTSTRISPRRRFLGALDADGDGKSELYFGLASSIARGELVTYSYKFTGDTWIADWEFSRTRCLR